MITTSKIKLILAAILLASCTTQKPLAIGKVYRTTRHGNGLFLIVDKQGNKYGQRDLSTGKYFIGSGNGLEEVR